MFIVKISPNYLLFLELCPPSESEVTQSYPTLCDPMDYSLPGFSVHMDFPGKSTGVGCHFLLQGIFLTQGSNPGLLHCRLCFWYKGWFCVLVCLCSFYVLVWGCVHPSGSPAYPVLLGFNGGFLTKAWLITCIFSPSLFSGETGVGLKILSFRYIFRKL